MIDVRALREDPQPARDSLVARGEDPALVDKILEADAARRTSLGEFESLRAEHKELSRSIGKASPEERPAVLARAKEMAADVTARQEAADAAATRADELLWQMPNLVVPGIPAGGEDDYEVLEHVGTPRDLAAEGVTVRDHLDIGESLRAIDVRRGTKVSGARFYYLTGIGARLELALL
ncbi:MAG: serine--tRNA ligase, partial [Actinomycetaceae bacterium]